MSNQVSSSDNSKGGVLVSAKGDINQKRDKGRTKIKRYRNLIFIKISPECGQTISTNFKIINLALVVL
jgi:hypothetical protein